MAARPQGKAQGERSAPWPYESLVLSAAASLRLRTRSRDYDDLMQVGRIAAYMKDTRKSAYWSARSAMIDWLRAEYGRDPKSAKRTREVVSLNFEGFGRTLAERVPAPESDTHEVNRERLELALSILRRANASERRVLFSIMTSESNTEAACRLGMSPHAVYNTTRRVRARAIPVAKARGIMPLRIDRVGRHVA